MKTVRQRVLDAILSGYRTTREVSSVTGIDTKLCSKHLDNLRARGKIVRTGFVRYPTETLTVNFYEPKGTTQPTSGPLARTSTKLGFKLTKEH
jgi:hypothetical protein